MPYEIPACAGKPYRPSNGTEGMMFQERYCFGCKHYDGPDGCPVFDASFWHPIGDPGYPSELTHDERGRPMCTKFDALTGGE